MRRSRGGEADEGDLGGRVGPGLRSPSSHELGTVQRQEPARPAGLLASSIHTVMPGSRPSAACRGSARTRKLLMSWSPTARAACQTANSPSGRISVTRASIRVPFCRPQDERLSDSDAAEAVFPNGESKPALASRIEGHDRLAGRDCLAELRDDKSNHPVGRREKRRLRELGFEDPRQSRRRPRPWLRRWRALAPSAPPRLGHRPPARDRDWPRPC